MVEEEFKEDFYIEVMRHNQEDENRVNTTFFSKNTK
jgi:DNA polymerase-3 subunit alpha